MKTYFYNANYNLGSPDGKYRYCWGVVDIDDEGLADLLTFFQKHLDDDGHKMYNFNLTAFNPI